MRYLQNSYVRGQPGFEVVTPTSKLCRRSTSLTPSTLLVKGEIHQRPSHFFQADDRRKRKTSAEESEFKCDKQPNAKTHPPQVRSWLP